jgi:hypothetical protein
VSWILSRGATMMSDPTTFLLAMTGRSIILALRAALSPIVLCRTLRCRLPADMVLQKKPTRFANNNPKEIFLLVLKKKIWHHNGNKMDFSKITNRKYHITVHNNTETDNPNTTDITNMHFIISTTFLK